MATAPDKKSRVINLRQHLDKDKLQRDIKSKSKQEQDIFRKTYAEITELSEKALQDEEFFKRGQTLVHLVKGGEHIFPPDFVKMLNKTFIAVENKDMKKEIDGKAAGARPRTPEKGQVGNQDVGFGPAPIQSPHSPKPKPKGTDVTSAVNADTEHLQKRIKVLEKNLSEKCDEYDQVKHLYEDRGSQLKELEALGIQKDKKIKDLEQEAENLGKRIQKENLELTEVKKELSSKQTMNEQLEVGLNGYVSREEKFKKDIDYLTFQNKKLENEMSKTEKASQRDKEYFKEELKQQARKFDDQYKKLVVERDDLRDRFSKLAGAKLQEKNADIADLSDPNRAMKLSEKFGQIYDDEWTNAFEVLTDKKAGFQLKDAISFLLRLLQECWSSCTTLMETQMESVHSIFLQPAQNLATFDKKKIGKKDRPMISSKDNQTLYDLRRKIGVLPAVLEEVKQALLSESKRWDKQRIGYDTKYVDACAPYIQKCAEICWLMALHDPPLYMKMEVKPGEKFDQNIYSVYSASGNTIDFLVWPPLYNGRDGGLLAKGVVEPLRTIGKKNGKKEK